MAGPLPPLGSALGAALGVVNKLASRPLGPLNPLDRLGRSSLADAVGGRVVLITGASSGIGAATALRIGPVAGTVILVARGQEKLEEVAAEVQRAGGHAEVHPCDLSDPDAIEAMAADVLARHGAVDVLVNNAGRSIRRSIALSYDRFHDFERTMELNYFAPLRLILRLLPAMRAQRHGQVVNISSAGVQTRVPRFTAYIASKAALDTLSDAVQAEVRADGVRFTTIHMPLVRTPMIAPTGIYRSFPALTPDEAAQLIERALVDRPRRISPPFGHLAAFADAITPETMDLVRSQGFAMFEDSRAARSDDAASADAPASRRGTAFAHLTRGTHW